MAYLVLKKTAIKQAIYEIGLNPDLQDAKVVAKAKRFDERVPNCLLTSISEPLAKTIRDTLIRAGAEVEISPTT